MLMRTFVCSAALACCAAAQVHMTAASAGGTIILTFQPDSKPASTEAPPHGAVAETEWLGTQSIDGLLTYGEPTTLRYPPGTLGGNDRLLVVVNESWTSPVLGAPVLFRMNDPEAGNSTATLTTATLRNLKFGEPDAALFRVPDDYQIVDDSQ